MEEIVACASKPVRKQKNGTGEEGMKDFPHDDFLRGYRPAMLFSGSIVTPSLEAAVLNAQYVNSNPLDRIAWDSQANGLISPADI